MNSNSDFKPEDTKSKLDYKYCEFCMSPIPRAQEIPYCPACQEKIIFHNVKEYIRANDVNEFQVADHFNIPLRMVKNWIKEGRIEYKELAPGQRTINSNMRCMKCGMPITFGTICTKCLRSLDKNIHGYDMQKVHEDDRMRFLDNDIKNK